MLTIRKRSSDNIDKRQKREFLDVAASGSHIPLKLENWSERWCSLPVTESFLRQIYEFQVKDDDVYVVTFPKCGTTWIQEAAWLLLNNLDFEKGNAEDLAFRSIFMDLSAIYSNFSKNTIELAEQASSPRLLKTHLPAHLIPKQIWEKKSKGNIDEFVEDIINNDIMYSPYWEHFWRMGQEKNIFFTTYEDMKRDLRAVLIKLNKFLEKPELSEEQLIKLEKHLSFECMKANKRVNPTLKIKSDHGSSNVRADFEFMRRGVVGCHKDELSPDVQKKLDEWIAKSLEKFDIKLEDIFGEF